MRRFTAAAALVSLFVLPLRSFAEPSEELPLPEDNSAIIMNFEGVELTAFIKFISKVTGRNFVFGDKIEGTVSVVSPTPVDPEQAFVLFQSVLSTQGLTTIDEGVVTRIVAVKDARTSGATVLDGEEQSAGFATRLIPLKYVTAGDVARVLAPQVSKDGSLVPYEGTNTIIVSDSAGNLARVAEMVAAMDIPGHEEVVAVIPLKHAEAVRMAEQIVEILMTGGGGGGGRRKGGGDDKDKNPSASPLELGFKITPDERTNSLIVLAPSGEMKRIRSLAHNLDTELRPGDERVHVYYAKNADAEDLVDVVSGMILGSKARGRTNRKKDDSALNPSSSQGLATSQPPPSASDDSVSITADPATNAVIVEGAAQEWKTILSLLEKLDIPRPQVFIEAILIEASTNNAKALGFDFQGALDVGAGDILLRSNIAELGQAFINPLSLGGLVAAAASDKQVELPDGTKIPANYALLQALDSTNDVEVLSAPTLLTLDNQQAEIIVGQNIPFITGRATDIANIDNVFTTVERRDVGIKLRVRPQVSEGDVVILEVEQEVSALVRNSLLDKDIAQVGPTTTIRSAKTTVSCGDGRTAVIGGLLSNRNQNGESKVPLLGDIPFLGKLFRYTRDEDEKVNLIVFLTPHVIRTTRDLDFVSSDRRSSFRGEMRDPTTPLPGEAAPPPPEGEKVTAIRATVGGTAATTMRPETRTAPPARRAPEPVREVAPATGAKAAPTRESSAVADSDAPRSDSTYRHAASGNERVYPLNKDTRERAPF